MQDCVEKTEKVVRESQMQSEQNFMSKDDPPSSSPFIKRQFILPSPVPSNMGRQKEALPAPRRVAQTVHALLCLSTSH
jgi:hypothetical protein